MRCRPLALGFLAVVLGLAQGALSWEQLRTLIQSSVKLKQSDKEVAAYLRQQKLAFSLSEVAIERLQGLGAGPRTLEALRELSKTSRGLPPPAPEAPPAPAKPAEPPPSAEEQKRIIEEARSNALAYSKRLPDFICLQLTRRYVDPTGLELDWFKYDELKARLTFFERHEEYKVISVNERLTNVPYESLGGATSTGEFGSMLEQLFAESTRAELAWDRHSAVQGRPVHVFRFRVPQKRSQWLVSFQRRQEVIAGYRGFVYVDKETGAVLRMTATTEDLPRDFPIQEARSSLEYGFAKIAERDYLLPLRATVRMREGKMLTRNEVEFRLYRKFSAEASIAFDAAELEAKPDEKPQKDPPPGE